MIKGTGCMGGGGFGTKGNCVRNGLGWVEMDQEKKDLGRGEPVLEKSGWVTESVDGTKKGRTDS